MDTSHLHALELNLSNERIRLSLAHSDTEKKMRSVWVKQLEKEVADEHKRLYIEPMAGLKLSDDDLFKEVELIVRYLEKGD